MRISDWSSDVCSSDLLLVVLVVLVFLQSWRTALIPIVAIPVSLIGTFAVMAAFGFSINMLTLFGMVLAIGIVVDDAIVVVENIERNMRLGYSPRESAHRTMDEVGSAVVSIALVLTAVFVPVAFIPGRSEEHTSELQSLMRISYAVLCLIKKNAKHTQTTTTDTRTIVS